MRQVGIRTASLDTGVYTVDIYINCEHSSVHLGGETRSIIRGIELLFYS